ncbi:hypothetical protein C4565_07945 [Candidatus Parcubacteria bacterium]|nr:MAG: hypothetical protein C4565_07945 [Candidatus Parcubacteria bacterium]
MREEERFEIERAYDLLPHVVGASWACVWFRLNKIKKPTREEFYQKIIEYLAVVERLYESYPDTEQFSEINSYMKARHAEEIEKILERKNPEIEKRYTRYIDYG